MHIPSDISSPFPCVIDFLTSFRLSVDTAPGSLAPAASGLTWTCSPPWEGRATPSTRLVRTGLRLPHSEALKPQQVAKTWALGPDALGSEFDYHSLDVWPMAVTSQRLHFYSCLKGWRIEWDSSWKAFSPRACRTGDKESTCPCRRCKRCWFDPLGQEDPLEEVRATHSAILAWRIPQTEEPGGLQSTGLQRVGHDWSDLAGYSMPTGNGQYIY